ncbi:hypothetical protein [Baekduia sp. Peel2402]|uniref:hypothetical protein n=1 Tax=Baekduia sp. Peel2402 TaxID=3458296 RepID=UPI00403E38BC
MLDLPPSTLPTAPVAEIATYGSTTVWVDPVRGVLVRRGTTTTALTIAAKGLKDLDLGPVADGTPTAVYVRCAPGCKVYAFSLKAGATATVRPVAAAAGGRLPTLWKGMLAFHRSRWVYTARLGSSAPAKKLMGDTSFHDMELGPNELAFAGEYPDEGNGITEVDLVPLRRMRGLWFPVDQQVIGEGSAAGYGGLTADDDGTFAWARASRVGCGRPKRVVRHGSFRHVGSTVPRSGAPLAARFADPDVPATPTSEDCGDE